MELLRSKAGERTVRLDPRTKMVMLFAVSTVLLLGGNGGTMFAVRTAMLLFPFGLLAISGRVRAAGLMLAAYLGTCALAAFAAPALEGIANAIIVATATVVSRFVPTLALAYFVFATTTVSEFMAAMARMRMPDWITIPLSVLFRFFPTLGQEARAVNAAMRMRGITPISRGIAYAENCLVPLMSWRRLHRRGSVCGRSGPRARRALAKDEHRQHRVHAGRCRSYRRIACRNGNPRFRPRFPGGDRMREGPKAEAPVLFMEDVSFSYAGGHSGTGVEGISLSLGRGEVALLCGPSGCGKTTVTRLANGLAPHFYEGAETGTVRVCGLDIAHAELLGDRTTRRQRLSEPQNPVL